MIVFSFFNLKNNSGGLEHRITNCPKLMKDQKRLNPKNSDAFNTDANGDW